MGEARGGGRSFNWGALEALAAVAAVVIAALALLDPFSGTSSPQRATGCAFGKTCTGEDAELAGTHLDSEWSGYSGRGYVAGFERAGSRATWTIRDVPAEGAYRFDVRYANYQGSDGRVTTRTLSLVVNGRTVRSLRFGTTPSWASWTDEPSVRVRLRTGVNRLALLDAPTDSGRINVDWIRVAPGT